MSAAQPPPASEGPAPNPGPAQVALGVCVDAGGRILLLRRRREPYAGLWSLPGGKREPGEALAGTCRRELCEELGCAAEVGGLRLLVDETLQDSAGAPVGQWLLAVFAFALPPGAGLPPEAAWFAPAGLGGLDVIPTDLRFIEDIARLGRFAAHRRLLARLDAAGRPRVLAYA